MLPLAELASAAALTHVSGPLDIAVAGVTADSRRVVPGGLFVAVPGLTVDGHEFIDRAIAAGARAVLAQAPYPTTPAEGVTWLQHADTAAALGPLAAAFYETPTQELALVGVTGTNGKTTVVTLCHDAFTALGYACGLIGTVEVRVGTITRPATHTTPDAVAVQVLLREMADAGCEYVFMEVSSHALVQGRVNGCRFAGAAFTNISHDHLDYHGDMLSYINAKKLLFDGLDARAFALVNADDKRGEVMMQNTSARKVRYALKQLADYKARVLDDCLRGLHLTVDEREVYTRLAGRFNAYNLLCAYGIGVELELDGVELLRALSALPGAVGRLEIVAVAGSGLTGIVDYAHTPDALKNVLETLQVGRKGGSRIITVFGCGGDRDAAKRPAMGATAAALSDRVVVTDDNPRTEEAAAIRESIVDGVAGDDRARVLEIGDRRQAIRTAVQLARDKDVVLLAGKGHETYQQIGTVKHDFDDRSELRSALLERVGMAESSNA